MEGFLKDLALWISDRPKSDDPSFVSPTGHVFALNDGDECRKAFDIVEMQYIDTLETKEPVDEEFSALLGNILTKLGDVRLVDNEEFIIWASTHPGSTPEDTEGGTAAEGAEGASAQDVPRLPDFAIASFFSAAGASPIRTEADLERAMTALYYGRAELGLESPDATPTPDFDNDALRDNCSNVTLQVAYNMEEEISVSAFRAADLENQREFLKDVALWLM